MQKTATLPTTTQKCLSVRSSMYLINTCSYTRNTMLLLVLLSLLSMTNPHTFERILWQKQKRTKKPSPDDGDDFRPWWWDTKKHVYLIRQLSLRFIILLREAIDRRRERGREYKPVNLNVLLRESSIGVAINTKFAGESASVMTLSTVHQHHTHTQRHRVECAFFIWQIQNFSNEIPIYVFLLDSLADVVFTLIAVVVCVPMNENTDAFFTFLCAVVVRIYMCVYEGQKKRVQGPRGASSHNHSPSLYITTK